MRATDGMADRGYEPRAMHEERRKILDMLAQGRLSAEEADRQLEALARSAERPVIDIEPETNGWSRQWRRWERLAGRWRQRFAGAFERRNWPTLLIVVPLAALAILAVVGLIGLVVATALVLWLGLPTLVIYGIWNGLLVQILPNLPAMGWVEAVIMALVLMIVLQGRRRWRP